MAKSVPTGDSMKDAGMTGVVDGGTLALGEILGRGVLGPGLGTTAGGIVAAAAEEGTTGDTMAMIAVERGAQELLGGM